MVADERADHTFALHACDGCETAYTSASRPTHANSGTIIGKLTTHVLDTAHGCPAAGISVQLHRLDGNSEEQIAQLVLDADGRATRPLLEGDELKVGRYRLVFDVAAYFRSRGVTLPDPPFLDRVTIEFAIADADAHYHVPLLVSPWAYSTYRGS